MNIKFKLESLNSIKISEVTKVKNGRLKIHSGFMVQIIYTARKMKVSIKDFSSKCDQIRSFQRIWSHLLKKSLLENFIFCAVLREKTYFTSSTNIARFIRVIYSITIISLSRDTKSNRSSVTRRFWKEDSAVSNTSINSFHTNVLYPLKTSINQRFSDISGGIETEHWREMGTLFSPKCSLLTPHPRKHQKTFGFWSFKVDQKGTLGRKGLNKLFALTLTHTHSLIHQHLICDPAVREIG